MNTYYDKDANLKHIEELKIAVIGYGIQGRAQALNLRDNKCNVIIGNIEDQYSKNAREDNFEVTSIADATKKSSIIMILIPDQAQKEIYTESIEKNLETGNIIIFAHGFSIHFKEIIAPQFIDVCLLAPRMPGKQIREYYLAGGGVPAFIDVYQDSSGNAWNIIKALAKGIGATRAGAMHITFKEETELDLFIEQFLLPTIIRSIRLSFDVLTKYGFTPEATLMELFGSGEIGELLLMAAETGIYRVWRNNASPTCQFGIYRNSEKILETESTKKMITNVLEEIRNGSFLKDLANEAQVCYKNLKEYDDRNEEALITKTQNKIKQIIKYRHHNKE